MIRKINLENFTVFSKLSLEFSPRVNVIIGENGTGKTHLLKATCFLCTGGSVMNGGFSSDDGKINGALTDRLLRLFMPIENKIGKLRSYGADKKEKARMQAEFVPDSNLLLDFHSNSKTVTVQKKSVLDKKLTEPVMIPTKEVLSFMEGFASLYSKYELSFDETYYNICLLLDLPPVRSQSLAEKSRWAMEGIEKTIGGKFIFHGGGRVTFKAENGEFSANTMAEGFRKFGMLSRLLETAAIQPGVSGPLLWDEPETNMNPKLVRLLVETLLELSRNGQQIIVATHDYVLLKWFDLLMDKKKEDHVRFHVLFRELDSGEIKAKSTDTYLQIPENAIAATFSDLYDSEIERSLGNKMQ